MKEQLKRMFKDPVTFPVNGIDFLVLGVAALGIGIEIGYILGRKAKIKVHPVPEKVVFDAEKVEQFIEEQEQLLKDKEEKKKEKPGRYTAPKPREPKPEPEPEPEVEIEVVEKPRVPGERYPGEGNEPITFPITAVDENGIWKVTETTPYGDNWNYSEEVLLRTSHEPYIIHHDEFHADELAYSQSTLTFYEGDEILVDEDSSPIYNHERIVGELKFGHGSLDPNVVYVRNDKRKSEYEILRDSGLYSTEVLGLHIENNQRVRAKEEREMKHSHNRTKFRQE